MARKKPAPRKPTRAVLENELELIRSRDPEGILRSEEVLKFAKNKRTALHSQFNWDDKKAAHKYRLIQAARLIRVHVETVGSYPEPVRAYVSLDSDRINGGGFRRTSEVLPSPTYRDQLLAQALRELQSFRRKYRQLEELCQVFEAAEKLQPEEAA